MILLEDPTLKIGYNAPTGYYGKAYIDFYEFDQLNEFTGEPPLDMGFLTFSNPNSSKYILCHSPINKKNGIPYTPAIIYKDREIYIWVNYTVVVHTLLDNRLISNKKKTDAIRKQLKGFCNQVQLPVYKFFSSLGLTNPKLAIDRHDKLFYSLYLDSTLYLIIDNLFITPVPYLFINRELITKN